MGLDGAHLRHQTLSNNIANVSTPEYKRKDVNFVDVLKRNLDQIKDNKTDNTVQLAATNTKHLGVNGNSYRSNFNGINKFKVNNYTNTSYRNDENNVDVDAEMAKLAKNNLYYNTLSQRIAGKFSMLQEVIQKGSE